MITRKCTIQLTYTTQYNGGYIWSPIIDSSDLLWDTQVDNIANYHLINTYFYLQGTQAYPDVYGYNSSFGAIMQSIFDIDTAVIMEGTNNYNTEELTTELKIVDASSYFEMDTSIQFIMDWSETVLKNCDGATALIVVEEYEENQKQIITNNKHYNDIAKALRNLAKTSKTYKPSEMAPALNKINTISQFTSVPKFANLNQALKYYDGEYGDALLFSNNYPIFRGNSGFTSTVISSAYYQYITSSTIGSSHIVLCQNDGVYVNKKWALSTLNMTAPRLIAFTQAIGVAGRGSTYNGSATVLQELSCDKVKTILAYAFQSFKSLTSISMPQCTWISNCAFRWATNLTDIYFPKLATLSTAGLEGTNVSQAIFENLTTMGPYGLFNCSNLSIASVGTANLYSHAFHNDINLTSIYFGGTSIYGSTTYANNYALANCPKLQTINAPHLLSISNLSAQFVVSGQNSASSTLTSNIKNWLLDDWSIISNAAFSFLASIVPSRPSEIRLGISTLETALVNASSTYPFGASKLGSDWSYASSDGYYNFYIGPSNNYFLWNLLPYSTQPNCADGPTVTLPNIVSLTGTIYYLSSLFGLSNSPVCVYPPFKDNINTTWPCIMTLASTSTKFEEYDYYYLNGSVAYPYVKELILPNLLSIGSFALYDARIGTLYCQNCQDIAYNAFSSAQISKIVLPNYSNTDIQEVFLSLSASLFLPKITTINRAFNYWSGSRIDQEQFPNVTRITSEPNLPNVKFLSLSKLEFLQANMSKVSYINLPNVFVIKDIGEQTLHYRAGTRLTVIFGSKLSSFRSEAFLGFLFTDGCSIINNSYYYFSDNNLYSYNNTQYPIICSGDRYFSGMQSIPKYYYAYKTPSLSIQDDKVITIGPAAFHCNQRLNYIKFPNVTTIGSQAFQYCSYLSAISFPNVVNIASSAFYYCSKLITADLPEVTTIGNYCFAFCSSLKSIYLSKLSSVAMYAFMNCSSLRTVIAPNVEYIGSGGFNRTSIPFLNFPRLQSMHSSAFYSASISQLYLNNSMVTKPAGIVNMNSVQNIMVPESLFSAYLAESYYSLVSSKFLSY